MSDSYPTIRSASEARGQYEKIVTVEGYYRELNVSQRPDRIVHIGRAYIEMEDHYYVVLETQKEGIRSKEEIAKFKDKKVRATGMFLPGRNVWGDGSEATIVGDCLSEIKSLDYVK